MPALRDPIPIRCSIPEDFLGPQALEVSTDGVQAPVGGIDAQRPKDVLGVYPVQVKGDAGNVLSVAWLFVAALVLTDDCTLRVQSPQREGLGRSVISI